MARITKAVLRQAKDLLSDPARWTRFDGAKDSEGDYAACNSPRATCFCMLGAIARVLDEPDWIDVDRELDEEGLAEEGGLPTFNDHGSTTHADVLAKFDELIALAPEAA